MVRGPAPRALWVPGPHFSVLAPVTCWLLFHWPRLQEPEAREAFKARFQDRVQFADSTIKHNRALGGYVISAKLWEDGRTPCHYSHAHMSDTCLCRRPLRPFGRDVLSLACPCDLLSSKRKKMLKPRRPTRTRNLGRSPHRLNNLALLRRSFTWQLRAASKVFFSFTRPPPPPPTPKRSPPPPPLPKQVMLRQALDDDMEGYAYMWRTHEIWSVLKRTQKFHNWFSKLSL